MTNNDIVAYWPVHLEAKVVRGDMQMRKAPFILAIITCLLQSGSAGASVGGGPVDTIVFMPNGVVLFNTYGTRSAVPSCSTVPNRWAINGATPGGQIQVAAVVNAYNLGRQISITGTGDCSVWADTETVSFFATVDR